MDKSIDLKQQFLSLVEQCVCKDRQDQYGNPENSFELIAKFWSDYLGYKITAENVAIMMMLLKIARQKIQHKNDNLIDIAGYCACLWEFTE